MSRFFGAAAVLTACVMGASIAQAQNVGIAGEYSEANGVIVQIPQNPPIIDCATAEIGDWDSRVLNARCPKIVQKINGINNVPTSVNNPDGARFVQPHHGNYGAQLGTASTAALPANPTTIGQAPGLNPGDAFRVPPFMMNQRLGPQIGIVLNNAVRQLDTTFTAAAPASSRDKNPPADTRIFARNAVAGGQDNGLTGGAQVSRVSGDQNLTLMSGLETVMVDYTAGPNEFGGTMTILLDGTGRLYLSGPAVTGMIPTAIQPAAATNPVGDTAVGFAVRNAAGWNYTVTGSQMAGQMKAYGVYPASVINAILAPACPPVPPLPAGCNEVNFFNTPFPGIPGTPNATPAFTPSGAPTTSFQKSPGVHLGFVIPGATSTKHMFPLTTGRVDMYRIGVRNGITFEDTARASGYDTFDGVERNVGLVAGSFSVRNSVSGLNINHQMLGVDFSFTPEPGATVALMSGLGLLGALAARRRR